MTEPIIIKTRERPQADLIKAMQACNRTPVVMGQCKFAFLNYADATRFNKYLLELDAEEDRRATAMIDEHLDMCDEWQVLVEVAHELADIMCWDYGYTLEHLEKMILVGKMDVWRMGKDRYVKGVTSNERKRRSELAHIKDSCCS